MFHRFLSWIARKSPDFQAISQALESDRTKIDQLYRALSTRERALERIIAATDIKTPNGTTKKIRRLAVDAYQA